MSWPNLADFGPRPFELAHLFIWDPILKIDELVRSRMSAPHQCVKFQTAVSAWPYLATLTLASAAAAEEEEEEEQLQPQNSSERNCLPVIKYT